MIPALFDDLPEPVNRLQEGFETFWASYPRKVGRFAAWRVWTRLKPSPDLLATILASIDAHRDCRTWREGFICHPVTFLRQGRWMDEVPVEPMTASERQHAEQVRKARGGCVHDPRCADYDACLRAIVAEARGR